MLRFVFFVLAIVTLGIVSAQGFSVAVESPKLAAKDFTLTVYSDGVTPHQVAAKRKGGKVTFVGKVEQPSYAVLRHKSAEGQLEFFIENSEIRIRFDKESPNSSPVVGSRSNSEMRYVLEQCDMDKECLTKYVAENPSSLYAPYIIDRYLWQMTDGDELKVLCGLLKPPKGAAYNHARLEERMAAMERLAEGSRMPDIEFTAADGNRCHTDSLWADSCMHVLLIGATWCGQCAAIESQLQRDFKEIQTITLYLDKEKDGWDCPWARMLETDHIPYLILLDADRRVVKSDLRIWELRKAVDMNTKTK